MRALDKKTKAQIAKAVDLRTKSDDATTSAVDLLIADGFKLPSDYISPLSEGATVTKEEWANLKAAIVLGFSKRNQALLAAPIKSLSEIQKATRRYWGQQINARIGDLKKQVTNRQDGGSNGAGSRNRSPDQRVRDNLNDIIKVCQQADKPTFNVHEMISKVKEALHLLIDTKATKSHLK
jgi:hypothetical protein